MEVSFEYVPEHYVGEYPCAIIRIKKSDLTPKKESEIRESLGDLRCPKDYLETGSCRIS